MITSRSFPEQAFRACLGVLRLGKRHGESRLEQACQRGLEAGATRYQHIESILKNRLEQQVLSNTTIPSLPSHENIRGPSYYQ